MILEAIRVQIGLRRSSEKTKHNVSHQEHVNEEAKHEDAIIDGALPSVALG